jgi:hypothetical protein
MRVFCQAVQDVGNVARPASHRTDERQQCFFQLPALPGFALKKASTLSASAVRLWKFLMSVVSMQKFQMRAGVL